MTKFLRAVFPNGQQIGGIDVQRDAERVGEDSSISHVLCPACAEKREQELERIRKADARGEGVIPVENYFNSSAYDVSGYTFSVTVKSGKLVSFVAETEMRYAPTGGEYVDGVITLKNKVELTVNDNLDKAGEYVAPKNVETKIGSIGLNNAKFYIL